MQATISRLAKNSFLQWNKLQYGISIRFPQTQLSYDTLIFITSGFRFKNLIQALKLQPQSIKYPQGITHQSCIYQFLMNTGNNTKNTGVVEILRYDNQKYYLRSSASDAQLRAVRNWVANSQSLVSKLNQYVVKQEEIAHKEQQQHKLQLQSTTTTTTIPSTINYTGTKNYFLNKYYLLISAQTYLKQNKISPNTPLTQTLKNQILTHISDQYQTNTSEQIHNITLNQLLTTQIKLQQTRKHISTLQSECQSRIAIYKYSAIAITLGHIISFGYMIFFVDWLGWDIIEPLTYSVSVLYTLLGIRFYRKYRTDRTGNNVRQILLKIVMNPNKLIQLKNMKTQLQIQIRQQNRVYMRLDLLRNKVNYMTSLNKGFIGNISKQL